MFIDGFVHQLPDIDPQETTEWLDSLDAVVDAKGKARARYLLARLMERAREQGVGVPSMVSTHYINTIPPEEEPWFPGDEHLERRIRAFIRWNAVGDGRPREPPLRRPRRPPLDLRVGRRALRGGLQPLLPRQGRRRLRRPGVHPGPRRARHLRPGVPRGPPRPRRDLERYRQDVDGGLPSYPHPRRLPEFWEFPTVSMGLGPINAVAQARFNRYLLHHEIADTSRAKVWCFVGDGEMDEPESTNGLSIAGTRKPRQPDLRRELQPAAPRRPRARQREDHPGARGDLPRRRLERHQGRSGAGSGTSSSPATSTACSSTR